MSTLLSELQNIFRQVFDDDDLVITESTSAADLDAWDSMAHINLIIAIEKHFGLRFSAAEIAGLGGQGQNVGNLTQLIEAKKSLSAK
jgi:acyl carrier protein